MTPVCAKDASKIGYAVIAVRACGCALTREYSDYSNRASRCRASHFKNPHETSVRQLRTDKVFVYFT
jgi:hypothetical protein